MRKSVLKRNVVRYSTLRIGSSDAWHWIQQIDLNACHFTEREHGASNCIAERPCRHRQAADRCGGECSYQEQGQHIPSRTKRAIIVNMSGSVQYGLVCLFVCLFVSAIHPHKCARQGAPLTWNRPMGSVLMRFLGSTQNIPHLRLAVWLTHPPLPQVYIIHCTSVRAG
jgi:hypothetical protein